MLLIFFKYLQFYFNIISTFLFLRMAYNIYKRLKKEKLRLYFINHAIIQLNIFYEDHLIA